MVEEWLSIAEVAKRLGLAENTARRYTHLFKEYITSKQTGRTMKYDPEAMEILANISRLYQEGLSTQEIQERLSSTYALNIEVTSDEVANAAVTIAEIRQTMAAMAEHIKHQEQFNSDLLKRLEERDAYIEMSIRDRDEKLMEALRELREGRLLTAASEEIPKPWWKWWK